MSKRPGMEALWQIHKLSNFSRFQSNRRCMITIDLFDSIDTVENVIRISQSKQKQSNQYKAGLIECQGLNKSFIRIDRNIRSGQYNSDCQVEFINYTDSICSMLAPFLSPSGFFLFLFSLSQAIFLSLSLSHALFLSPSLSLCYLLNWSRWISIAAHSHIPNTLIVASVPKWNWVVFINVSIPLCLYTSIIQQQKRSGKSTRNYSKNAYGNQQWIIMVVFKYSLYWIWYGLYGVVWGQMFTQYSIFNEYPFLPSPPPPHPPYIKWANNVIIYYIWSCFGKQFCSKERWQKQKQRQKKYCMEEK